MKRKQDGRVLMDDDELAKQLFLDWSQLSDEDSEEALDDEDNLDYDSDLLSPARAKRKKSSSKKKSARSSRKSSASPSTSLSSTDDDEEDDYNDRDEDSEGEFGLAFDDDLEVSSNAEDDLIEVYDEDGELVGVYDLQEFQKIKSSGQAS